MCYWVTDPLYANYLHSSPKQLMKELSYIYQEDIHIYISVSTRDLSTSCWTVNVIHPHIKLEKAIHLRLLRSRFNFQRLKITMEQWLQTT
ncbi:rCG58836 [Rattus norvegicus]|uniref:RCG58836 n=1 Tax=Rattus norvegicus TaxID=10116 RepID=A6JL21_RAT|nr:rCG58836 [Rattus norvegicus]